MDYKLMPVCVRRKMWRMISTKFKIFANPKISSTDFTDIVHKIIVMSTKIVSKKELEAHATEGNGWCVINEDVYDLSKFYGLHPVSPPVFNKPTH